MESTAVSWLHFNRDINFFQGEGEHRFKIELLNSTNIINIMYFYYSLSRL